ncbi:MAG: amidohydrolase [Stenotrophomonas sp.]
MRQRRVGMLVAVLMTVPAWGQAQPSAEVSQAVQAATPQLQAWRRDLHQHPELGGQERRTADIVARHLRALGLQPRTGIAGTGVAAVLKGGRPGPKILIRADMDALPVREETGLPFASQVTATYRGQPVGVMHACGHDAHVAILLGVAQALAARRDSLPGEVMFVFQPAEEGPAVPGAPFGAKLMLDEGLLRDFTPEAAFGLHVWAGLQVGQVGFRSGPLLASADEWSLTVTGRQTHGSRPWDGVDPITVGAQVLLGTQSMIARQVNIAQTPVVLTAGQFNSGVRFNIIPEQATLVGTLRTFDAQVREDVIARFERIATDYAHAAGATAALTVVNNAPATINDPVLSQRVRPSLEKVAGAGQVVEMPLQTIAEDFSQFASRVPGFYFLVGSTGAGIDPAQAPANHSPRFLLDEAALANGMAAMLQVTTDYLEAGATR